MAKSPHAVKTLLPLQRATDNGVTDGRSTWLTVSPHPFQSSTLERLLHGANASYKSRSKAVGRTWSLSLWTLRYCIANASKIFKMESNKIRTLDRFNETCNNPTVSDDMHIKKSLQCICTYTQCICKKFNYFLSTVTYTHNNDGLYLIFNVYSHTL